jgi:hypothetical protein
MSACAIQLDQITKGRNMKSLKIPKGYSEFVNGRRTEKSLKIPKGYSEFVNGRRTEKSLKIPKG